MPIPTMPTQAVNDKIKLKSMRCPTCGGSLNAKNDGESIECVYCGNTVVPVFENSAPPPREASAEIGGVLRIEGIKTPSSALAYLEILFEEYDWESFSYSEALSVAEIDKLANSLKTNSADDKNTWLVCFKATSVPFTKKIEGCKHLLSSIVKAYKNGDPDAYSKFDAYKRIATKISASKDTTIANLEKIIANATKYGASENETFALSSEVDILRSASSFNIYNDVENIPEIQQYNIEKNTEIANTLATSGIDAEREYSQAKAFIEQRRYVDALSILRMLNGYADSKTLIEKIDKYFLISDFLEIEGNLYYFKKSSNESNLLNLYPTINGRISDKPIITNIANIITNYADMLYYIDGNNRVKMFNLAINSPCAIIGENSKEFKRRVQNKTIHVYNMRVFLIPEDASEYNNGASEIYQIDLRNCTARTVLSNITNVISFNGNKIIFTSNQGCNIINVDTMEILPLGNRLLTVVGYINNCAVYTQDAPNNLNKNLYIKSFSPNEPEILLEKNIYKFEGIKAGKLFYYVGNSSKNSLISINCDGTERKELPLFVNKLLFEQSGWIYFIRRAFYTSILCKSRLDGSKLKVIATNIDEFVEFKNGYLYYLNDDRALIKVRMDGSNSQKLCNNVEDVLVVKEDKIVFVSVDDSIRIEDITPRIKKVKSIYKVDFSGSGITKLAYDVKTTKKYDDNTVYYVSVETFQYNNATPPQSVEALYLLDIETEYSQKLLEAQFIETSTSYAAIFFIIMAIALVLGFILLGTGNAAIGIILSLLGAISGVIGGVLSSSRKR